MPLRQLDRNEIYNLDAMAKGQEVTRNGLYDFMGASKNAVLSALASTAGAPGDMEGILQLLQQAKKGYVLPQKKTQLPNSEDIAGRIGADLNTPSGWAGQIGVPDLGDLGKIAMFAGVKSFKTLGKSAVMTSHGKKTAEILAKDLRKAEKLADNGVDPWKETGFFKGKDGHWRYEIDDSRLGIKRLDEKNREFLDTSGGAMLPMELSDFVKHVEVTKAYPDLKSAKATLTANVGSGEYLSPTKNYFKEERLTLPGRHSKGVLSNPESARSVAGHEIQHGVQYREGFAEGGSPWHFVDDSDSVSWDKYYKLAAEVEARNVQTRLNYSPAQRKLFHPTETQDVPFNQQILKPR